MSKVSSKKTEQKAITIIEDLVNKIECADPNINKSDTKISWDGTIDFYDGTIDRKDNFCFSIDVQVKGRTKNKKKLSDKTIFDLEVADLRNYSKKDGTLLLVVEFKSNSDEYKIYFSDLLPYNIARNLKSIENTSIKKIKIKMKELKNSEHLEEICRNFQINKSIQKRMSIHDLLNDNVTMNSETISRFSVWEKNMSNFCPENLVGTYQYIYIMDKNEYPIGVKYSMIFNMSKQLSQPVMSIDKSILYDDLTYCKSTTSNTYTFGKAFTINTMNYTFNIKVCGTLNERLKQLSFVKSIAKEKKFLIGNQEFLLDDDISGFESFIELDKKYHEFKDILKKHNIVKDVNLDLWTQKDFDEFNIWMNAIEFNNKIILNSDISRMGNKKIQDIRLSVIASKCSDGLFEVDSIWNYGKYDRYNFKTTNGSIEIVTNNLFLNLNEEAYLSDDINFNEMKDVISNCNFTNNEFLLLNLQVLDVIKAYDKTGNEELLNYALFLTNLLLKEDKEQNDIYFINYCQILKRQKKLTKKEIEQLIIIRNKTNQDEIKLCCNALIDNKNETELMLKKLDNETITIFKDYPIGKYLFN